MNEIGLLWEGMKMKKRKGEPREVTGGKKGIREVLLFSPVCVMFLSIYIYILLLIYLFSIK